MKTLDAASHWQRTRAITLHEHFCGITERVRTGRSTLKEEIARMSVLIDGKLLSQPFAKPERRLSASPATLLRNYYEWRDAGCQAASLILDYKPGCGGHKRMPEELVMEIQRRCTLPYGGRDKHGKAPISVVMHGIKADFAARRPLPGVDYDKFPPGAELPWTYRTVCRKKPARQMRALGNRGVAAHKALAAYISMNYTRLRKGEMYTLDDVRLDVLCIDERTGLPIEVVIYILMEVGSRSIVAYVMKPRAAIKAEDVDELLAMGLQTRGFGIGVDYLTHLYFERGTTACSEGAQGVLESMTHSVDPATGTESGLKVHRTGMITGVRWIGSPSDKASGNAAAKGVIESFNRRLHFALLHLPGQRGNNFVNAPASVGFEGPDSFTAGSLAAHARDLAGFKLSAEAEGQRVNLKLPMLYFMQLHTAVREAIERHNTESGHAYSGHGAHYEAEVQPGVWQRQDAPPDPVALPPARNIHFDEIPGSATVPVAPSGVSPDGPQSPKSYKLFTPAVELTMAQKNALYWATWNKIKKAQACDDNLRFALTRRVLGKVVKIKDMTPDQFRKVLHCFEEVLKQSTPGNANLPIGSSENQPF